MKKNIILYLALIFNTWSFSQEFQFQLSFEDAIGNKDSIILGYDTNGTDTLDPAFGEINILKLPLDSIFDVRIGNVDLNNSSDPDPTFQTKKQIIKNKCSNQFSEVYLEIHCKNWPVTASWNNALFVDSCNIGSLFTSIYPGGWFDTSSPSDLGVLFFKDKNQVTFTTNVEGDFSSYYHYINKSYDTIAVFFLTFGDSSRLSLGKNELEQLNEMKLFPNPTNAFISLKLPENFGALKEMRVYDKLGKEVLKSSISQDIDVRSLDQGIYVLVAESAKGRRLLARWVKK